MVWAWDNASESSMSAADRLNDRCVCVCALEQLSRVKDECCTRVFMVSPTCSG